jgi:molybdopterin synthase catalytic subunit
MNTHTSIPWRAELNASNPTSRIIHRNTVVAHCSNRQDTLFIVRACNSHRPLLEACEAFVEAFKDSADFADCPLAKARAAIAEVKGGAR